MAFGLALDAREVGQPDQEQRCLADMRLSVGQLGETRLALRVLDGQQAPHLQVGRAGRRLGGTQQGFQRAGGQWSVEVGAYAAVAQQAGEQLVRGEACLFGAAGAIALLPQGGGRVAHAGPRGRRQASHIWRDRLPWWFAMVGIRSRRCAAAPRRSPHSRRWPVPCRPPGCARPGCGCCANGGRGAPSGGTPRRLPPRTARWPP
ncbi:hypothetical protein D3C78_784540 [compost metagenome]